MIVIKTRKIQRQTAHLYFKYMSSQGTSNNMNMEVTVEYHIFGMLSFADLNDKRYEMNVALFKLVILSQ